MTGFSESLTVQILADSSQFDSELGRVQQRLEQINQQLQQMSQGQRGVAGLANGFRQLVSPLSQVSSLLTRVSQQVNQLNGMSVSLNVSPALSALNQLSAAIERVASQLRALTGAGLGGGLPTGGGGGGGGNGGGGGRGYAAGGLVTGPGGLDRVPARLTAGEFVMQREAVAHWGSSLLESLNRNGRGSGLPAGGGGVPGGAVHQYGEINIHVTQPGQVGEVLRDLQAAGHRMKNRWG